MNEKSVMECALQCAQELETAKAMNGFTLHHVRIIAHYLEDWRKVNGRPIVAKTAFEPRALKLKEAAKYLNISPISVRRLIDRGLIKPHRALRHIIIPVAELNRYLEQ